MENSKQSAFPLVVKHTEHEDFDGLTKREYFAAKAMQGLMTTLIPTADYQLCQNYENVKYMADLAVSAADELLEALNK